jgi:hypothetical protein
MDMELKNRLGKALYTFHASTVQGEDYTKWQNLSPEDRSMWRRMASVAHRIISESVDHSYDFDEAAE